MLVSGIADVCEWYDDDLDQFRIEVEVWNPQWGKLFGYRGTFDVEWREAEKVPDHVQPVRVEKRE